jgi:hypothetical protein
MVTRATLALLVLLNSKKKVTYIITKWATFYDYAQSRVDIFLSESEGGGDSADGEDGKAEQGCILR